MGDHAQAESPKWLLSTICWITSAYFASGFLFSVGFPPQEELLIKHAASVIACLLFLFIPFFKKIKIGKILEIEKDVERTKEDVREFKSEVRHNLALLSTNVNTMVGTTNQFNFNSPTSKEVREAEKEGERALEQKIEDKPLPNADATPLRPIPATDTPPSEEALKQMFEEDGRA